MQAVMRGRCRPELFLPRQRRCQMLLSRVRRDGQLARRSLNTQKSTALLHKRARRELLKSCASPPRSEGSSACANLLSSAARLSLAEIHGFADRPHGRGALVVPQDYPRVCRQCKMGPPVLDDAIASHTVARFNVFVMCRSWRARSAETKKGALFREPPVPLPPEGGRGPFIPMVKARRRSDPGR